MCYGSSRTTGNEEIGIDALHHLVYAMTTSIAYAFLDRIDGPEEKA